MPIASPPLSRRRFVQAAGAATTALWLPQARSGGGSLEAYAGATSVRQGDALVFYARDPLGSLTLPKSVPISFFRIGATDQMVASSTALVRNQKVPANASTAGCAWASTYTLRVASNWPSGLYYAALGSGVLACYVPFVVTPASPTPGAKVLVQIPFTTAQAYNNYGGKSLYAYNSSGGVPATRVSFDRPFVDRLNFAVDPWQADLVRWLARNGVVADFCTSVDVHANTNVTRGYQLFLTAGHDEYWSRAMRVQLDTFIAGGGNVAILSGNTCWWQVRFEANLGVSNRTMVCYKSRTADPETRAAFKTTNWIDLVPPEPENSTIGLSWNLGASWTNGYQRPDTPYAVQRAEHWVFDGTGLAVGATFGGAYCGYECDALAARLGSDGRHYPTATDGTPPTLRVLAWADASGWDAAAKALGLSGEKSGHGAISIHSKGGTAGAVFNGGTIDWIRALQPELNGQTPTPFSRITRNVINRLSDRHVESADVLRWRNRQSNGDGFRHFFGLVGKAPAGATLDGMVFRAFIAPVANSVPVYRYKFPQANGDGERYHYSLNPNLGYGWIADGIAFHAYASQQPGTAAIYQHHIVQANGDGWRMTYSANLVEPGWVFDDVAFFAPLA